MTPYTIYDPVTGQVLRTGTLAAAEPLPKLAAGEACLLGVAVDAEREIVDVKRLAPRPTPVVPARLLLQDHAGRIAALEATVAALVKKLP